MNSQNLKYNDPVIISFPYQEIQGTIIKINSKTAKVKLLEKYKHYPVNTIFNVDYSFLRKNTGTVKEAVIEKLKYNPFGGIQNIILDGIVACYCALSPENLTCDGEASRSSIANKSRELQRQLKGLCYAYGREVGEMESIDWEMSKREYEEKTKKVAVPS